MPQITATPKRLMSGRIEGGVSAASLMCDSFGKGVVFYWLILGNALVTR